MGPEIMVSCPDQLAANQALTNQLVHPKYLVSCFVERDELRESLTTHARSKEEFAVDKAYQNIGLNDLDQVTHVWRSDTTEHRKHNEQERVEKSLKSTHQPKIPHSSV